MELNPSFWHGKKVLLTGHTGFKGSWLSLWLQMMNAKVTGYALLPPTEPSLFDIANIQAGMNSVIADVRNAPKLKDVVRDAQPEIIFHLAAQPLVRYSYEYPVETYSTNIMGTVNLYEAIRQVSSVKCLINVTSDKCYENRETNTPYKEADPMGGHDPYSSSKACSELVTNAYRNSYFKSVNLEGRPGIALASVRAGNVIGGGDWAEDRLIPDIIKSIVNNIPVEIRNPQAIRPWQHVLEPLFGYLQLAERLYILGPEYAEAWNFGPNSEDVQPVEWIVEELTRLWGESASWRLDKRLHPHEAQFLRLDCSKAKKRLDWEPRWNLEEALCRIIDWYKGLQAGQDMRELSINQINAYLNKL